MKSQMTLDFSLPDDNDSDRDLDEHGSALALRVAEFKADPNRMEVACTFVDDLLKKAQQEAEVKAKEKEKEEPLAAAPVPSGRRASKSVNRMASRARGVIVNWFESLCNCTTTSFVRRGLFKNRSQSQAQKQP